MNKIKKTSTLFEIRKISFCLALLVGFLVPGFNSLYAKSSLEERQDKKFSLHTDFSGLSIGKYHNPDFIWVLDIRKGRDTLGGIELLRKRETYHLGVEKFFSNSFYGTSSFAYRKVSVKDSEINFVSGAFRTEPTKVTSYEDFGVHLGIGNRWQWENFSLGFEWIGIYAPLTKSSAKQVYANGDRNGQDVDGYVAREIYRETDLTSRLLIGVSF